MPAGWLAVGERERAKEDEKEDKAIKVEKEEEEQRVSQGKLSDEKLKGRGRRKTGLQTHELLYKVCRTRMN